MEKSYIYISYIYNYIYIWCIYIYGIYNLYIWYIYICYHLGQWNAWQWMKNMTPKIWPGTATEVELQIGLKDYDTQRDKRFAGAGGADLWTGSTSAVEKASNLGWFHSGFDEDSELPCVSLNSNSFWTELVHLCQSWRGSCIMMYMHYPLVN